MGTALQTSDLSTQPASNINTSQAADRDIE